MIKSILLKPIITLSGLMIYSSKDVNSHIHIPSVPTRLQQATNYFILLRMIFFPWIGNAMYVYGNTVINNIVVIVVA